MPALPLKIDLTADERAELERIVRAHSAERRLVERARIVLLAAEGLPATDIAELLGCDKNTVNKWRSRFRDRHLDGLGDLPRPGKHLVHGHETRAKLIAKACTRPAALDSGQRRERWTYQELADEVGMSRAHAHSILAAADIKPHLVDGWVMSDLTPEFFERAGEICGLYLDPPENALVVSIDEKTSIQAKGLTRADTSAQPGKPGRRDHEYKRNGTMNLFSCLEVHAGSVTAMTAKTRNTFDFIGFLDYTDQHLPDDGRRVIAILDNLSTHTTPEVDAWLEEHPRWEFVFTPTHASWLNQVEIFFSILARRVLKHGAFDSEADLVEQMLTFVETYNQSAQPFNWTYTGKVLTA
ncbi:MAG TPA: IS630 family transposase [Gemmatimonadaceae bacterium]|nr:IS630 family transposase [Gemmatimonadaceae bacterium]